MTTSEASVLVRNALSVDVEDWFQVQAFAKVIPQRSWDGLPIRVERNTDHILALLDGAQVKATFFILGWVAARKPALVRRIRDAGHEIASHGYGHELVHAIGPVQFRDDIRRAKAVLEDAAGVPVAGYRAPTFSIGPATPWAHTILAEEGHAYSSSIYPVRHDLYGSPDAPRQPYWPHAEGVLELPLTTLRLRGRNIPCAGGGWFRLVPYRVYGAALRRVNATEGMPGIFYFHPWELDPDQPRVWAGPLAQFRHYTGLTAMEGRLKRLLREFRWGRMDEVFAPVLRMRGTHRPLPTPQEAA